MEIKIYLLRRGDDFDVLSGVTSVLSGATVSRLTSSENLINSGVWMELLFTT